MCNIQYVLDRRQIHTGFWWETIYERGCLEDQVVDGRIILKCMLKKHNGRLQTGLDLDKVLLNTVMSFRVP
jgi:hypothetical protein